MSLLKLTNAPFDIEFAGKLYTIKQATIEQVVRFNEKTKELLDAKAPAIALKMMVYGLYLSLSSVDTTITEAYVADNLPGNSDGNEILTTLGFINPKLATPSKAASPTSEPSSQPSLTAPDGLQAK